MGRHHHCREKRLEADDCPLSFSSLPSHELTRNLRLKILLRLRNDLNLGKEYSSNRRAGVVCSDQSSYGKSLYLKVPKKIKENY